jgi:hypothetical protein
MDFVGFCALIGFAHFVTPLLFLLFQLLLGSWLLEIEEEGERGSRGKGLFAGDLFAM